MRKFLLLIVSLLPVLSFAQYANDWIPFSALQSYSLQEYYRIPVAKNGVYRIYKSDLVNGLVSVANNPNFDHRRFQIFNKGVEQHIYIYDENQNNVLEANDYIEFVGKINDGALDLPMYNNPTSQANPNYSMINDTAVYYLTWVTNTSPPFNTKRYQVSNDTNFQNYIPAAYFQKTVRRDYYSVYYSGNTAGFPPEDFDLEYTATEGWFDVMFEPGAPANKTLPTPNVYTSGPQAQFETVFIGASNVPAQIDHQVKLNFNGNQLSEIIFDGYEIRKEIHSIAASSLLTNNTVNFTALNPSSSTSGDRNAVSYVTITYPHSASLAGEGDSLHRFIIPYNNSAAKTYLELTNFPMTGSNWFILDLTDNVRIPVDNSNGTLKALIANAASGTDKEIILYAEPGVLNVTNTVKPVNTAANPRFRNYNAAGATYDYIIITHSSLMSAANTYANYRNNTGYNVLVVDIDDLYGQFIYGVRKHPMSIRNFTKFVLDKWSTPPKQLFLLGKGIHARNMRPNPNGNYPNKQTNSNNPGVYNSFAAIQAKYAECLVPSFGNPSSDILLTAKILPGALYEPAIATGRLSAHNNQQVLDYLNKVTSYENQLPAKWMKEILHFGGGSSAGEQQTFKDYLNEYASIISNPFFGGHVESIFKTSSDPIQINLSEAIKAKIDSGVTMMTFFGHASGGSFDVTTDHPSTFNNKDRYHIVLANSCYAGDIHLSNINNNLSTSENFVMIPDKAAIAFIAHIHTEYAPNFYPYSKELYEQISQKNYAGALGESMKNTIKNIEDSSLAKKTISLGMTLHGDPAIVPNSHEKPDYKIDNSDISFNPQEVTTEFSTFTLNVDVHNIGKATNDTFLIEIKRRFADGSEDIFTDSLFNVYNTKYYSKEYPVDPFKGPGLNIFEVKVDAANHVDELQPYGETNNTASAQLLIKSSDVTPVYPYEFDIVPVNTLQLKASTANPFDLTQRNYIFEIDTTDSFDSPAKQQYNVTSGGGVVSTQLLNLNYEQVYYWRVTVNNNGNYNWRESSFICKPNITGWSQAHFYQFKKDKYHGVEYDKPNYRFDFVTNISQLQITNTNQPGANLIEPGYMINQVTEDYGACQAIPSIHIVVLDSLTHRPWETRHPYGSSVLNPNNYFGNANDMGVCRPNRPDKYFIFRANDPAQLNAMKDMINNSIPDGHYVIAYSVFNGLFSTWSNDVYTAFENLGADSVRFLADNQPWIFFTKKGDTTTTEEVMGASSTSQVNINLYKTLIGNWDRGNVTSTVVGPAKSWTSLHWQQSSIESPSTDSVYLNVIGIDNAGNESILISNIEPSTPVINLSSSISASAYPYLKLQAVMKDTIHRTPPQLDYWQIYYQGVPELALNPAKHFHFSKDTVQHGENIKLSMAIENISSYDADSVLVDFYVFNKNKVRVPLDASRYKALVSGDTLIAGVEFSTLNFPELNSLWIEANPANDQPEQYHFNNLGEIKFYAQRDVINPILDVTFDGIHILSGDIVSSKPHIVISLKDENKFLVLEDTTNFAVFLTYPDGRQEKLHFEPAPGTFTDNTLLKWYPASLPKNSFKIEYMPHFVQDGKYELRVQAKDASDNISGINEYRISFEVINKSTITQVLNYPNPFSTSTRFVFILTGSEIPVNFKIQIMTVTGKIVREITAAELGPMRIGRNITDYAWDGTDEYGDRLANGLYLYRVVSQINGATIEKRETEADKFFTRDWGKMYILR